MSNDLNETEEVVIPSRVDSLKGKLDAMGVKYHPKAGEAKLAKLYEDALSGKSTKEEKEVTTETKEMSVTELREATRKEALKLVRVVVTCRDPNKKEWQGELLTVANPLIGTIRKFIPFNAENGWHIPQIMYNMLKEKKLQVFSTIKAKNGVSVRKGRLVPMYDVTVLPPLSEDELAKLANSQKARQAIDD